MTEVKGKSPFPDVTVRTHANDPCNGSITTMGAMHSDHDFELRYRIGAETAMLDGDFTAEQLRVLADYMDANKR